MIVLDSYDLTYIYTNDKPLFSQLYTDIFETTSVGYKWKDYTLMDQSTGLEYARNALKYYTLGVEYTPFEGYGYNLYSREMNAVWDRIKKNSNLMGWVSGTSPGARESSYMNSSVTLRSLGANDVIKTEAKTAAINKENNLYKSLTVRGAENTTFELKKIELLSSKNIAPLLKSEDDNIEYSKVWKLKYTYEESDGTKIITDLAIDEDTNISKAARGQLNDGSIGLSNNLNIVRDPPEVNAYYGIGVGYEFDELKSINAISVKIGENPSELKEPYTGATVGFEEYPKVNEDSDEWIWEVRIKFASNIYRIFSFWDKNNLIVLTHGLIKKTQKTPAKEIKQAEEYRRDYLRRKNNELR